MDTYKRHRFPPDIICYAVRLYYKFNLSHRDIEDLLAERGITVSHESVRLWCIKFGALHARRLKRKHRGYGDSLPLSCLPRDRSLGQYAVPKRNVKGSPPLEYSL